MAKKKMKMKSKPKPKVQMKSKPKAKQIVAKSKSSSSRKASGTSRKASSGSRKAAATRKSAKTSVRAPGYQWINAYLTVRNVAEAIDFYTKAFGFRLRASMPGPDGKIMHAEMFHNDSVLMMGPENPQAPAPQGPSPVTLFAYVDDVDALTAQAQSAGANVVSPPKDEFWGDRCAILIDPQGHTWMLGTHKRDLSMEDMQQAMGGGQS